MLHAPSLILCALDLSPDSQATLVRAADLAERFHASLVLLTVDPLFHAPAHASVVPGEPDAQIQKNVRAFAARALGGEDALAVVAPKVTVRRGEYAGDAIVAAATETGAGLVVVGTHGRRGVQRLLAGSVAEDVARRAPCSVLVVPNEATRTEPHADAPVIAAVDFSTHTPITLAWADHLAGLYGAPVELLNVIAPSMPTPSFYADVMGPAAYDIPALAEGAEVHLRHLADGLSADACARTRIGTPHVEIAELAREREAGLIVMATRGLSGFTHVLLGSVAERTLRHAPCPVLIVRDAESDATDTTTP